MAAEFDTDADGRIFLRRVSRSDRREFLQLMQISRHLHEPWISPPLTEVRVHHYLSRTERYDHEGMLICRKQDNAIAGVININNIVRGSFLSASLGYYAGVPFGGVGLMREGMEMVKKYAFYTLGLHRLEANIQPDNLRSIALVKQCGFEIEGTSRQFLYTF